MDKGADVVTLEHPQVGDAYRRTTLTVVRDRAGQPLYLFAQCQDVTPQRIAELELRHSEQRFRLMVDAVREYAIFMLDTEGHVTSWNVGAERAKGWTAAEVIGQHFRVFYPREQQEARHPEHELEVAARDGVYQEEGWRVRKDGSRFWAFVTITKITDEDGHHIGFAKVTRDHTERMQMLEQRGQYADALAEANTRLEQANAELATAAEEQARFLAITAHELRSPGRRPQRVRPDARGELGAPRPDRARRAAGRPAEQCRRAPAAAGRPAHDVAAAGGHPRPRPRGARPGRGARAGAPAAPRRPS